jgi:hypothetical protein
VLTNHSREQQCTARAEAQFILRNLSASLKVVPFTIQPGMAVGQQSE